jgi:hypothetical protein
VLEPPFRRTRVTTKAFGYFGKAQGQGIFATTFPAFQSRSTELVGALFRAILSTLRRRPSKLLVTMRTSRKTAFVGHRINQDADHILNICNQLCRNLSNLVIVNPYCARSGVAYGLDKIIHIDTLAIMTVEKDAHAEQTHLVGKKAYNSSESFMKRQLIGSILVRSLGRRSEVHSQTDTNRLLRYAVWVGCKINSVIHHSDCIIRQTLRQVVDIGQAALILLSISEEGDLLEGITGGV